MKFRITLIATALALSSCDSVSDSLPVTNATEEKLMAEEGLDPVESDLDYVSKYIWTRDSSSCQDAVYSSDRQTYDMQRGLIIYSNGTDFDDISSTENVDSTKAGRREFNINEEPDGHFSYHLIVYSPVNPKVQIAVLDEKISIDENKDMKIESKSKTIKDSVRVESLVGDIKPNTNPEYYETSIKTKAEKMCGTLAEYFIAVVSKEVEMREEAEREAEREEAEREEQLDNALKVFTRIEGNRMQG